MGHYTRAQEDHQREEEARDASWVCKCGHYVYGHVKKCSRCDQNKYPETALQKAAHNHAVEAVRKIAGEADRVDRLHTKPGERKPLVEDRIRTWCGQTLEEEQEEYVVLINDAEVELTALRACVAELEARMESFDLHDPVNHNSTASFMKAEGDMRRADRARAALGVVEVENA